MPKPPRMLKIAAGALMLSALWLAPSLAQTFDSPAPEYQSQMTDAQAMGAQVLEPKGMSVPFDHNEHNKKAKVAKCATCHHPLPGVKSLPPLKKGGQPRNPTDRKCSDCHKARPGASDLAPSLMMASHKLCQDCHTKQAKGPVQCSGCHKNEAK